MKKILLIMSIMISANLIAMKSTNDFIDSVKKCKIDDIELQLKIRNISEVQKSEALFQALKSWGGCGSDVIKLLLISGANPNRKNSVGYTPLQAYIQDESVDHNHKPDINIIKLLLNHGAEVNFKEFGATITYDGKRASKGQNVIYKINKLQPDIPLTNLLLSKAAASDVNYIQDALNLLKAIKTRIWVKTSSYGFNEPREVDDPKYKDVIKVISYKIKQLKK